jgi:hypothetical protein
MSPPHPETSSVCFAKDGLSAAAAHFEIDTI